jgi:hypothetical protein
MRQTCVQPLSPMPFTYALPLPLGFFPLLFRGHLKKNKMFALYFNAPHFFVCSCDTHCVSQIPNKIK